jgi:orotate phosphoribosyltransferase-like protein
MAYDPNRLSRFDGILDGSWGMWLYRSADNFATAKAANYFSDAFAKGVKARDIIYIVDTATPATTIANVLTVTATTCTVSKTGVVVAE